MVNKRVPDWLNNSMWSAPTTSTPSPPKSQSQSSPSQSPSHADRVDTYPSKPPSVASSDSSMNEPCESLPSPSSIRPESPSKPGMAPRTEVKDRLSSGSSSNDISSPVEDLSRQLTWTSEICQLQQEYGYSSENPQNKHHVQPSPPPTTTKWTPPLKSRRCRYCAYGGTYVDVIAPEGFVDKTKIFVVAINFLPPAVQ
ncbi:hypothetical protein LXL04_011598 [Taraxacum kok-saghyz]